MLSAIPVGSAPAHGPPTTPTTLVQDNAELLAVPDTLAVPVHVFPSRATPLNVSWPLNDPPLSVPDT